MDNDVAPSIPSSMRPSKSLIAHVKSTLSDLVSSVFKTSRSARETVNEKGDANEDLTRADETLPSSEESFNTSCAGRNGNSTLHVPSPLSKSQFVRRKEAYTKRVKSFSLSWWCGKPLSLSPPLLAQYGWECVGENIAKCCICGAMISIHLPWPNSSNYHAVCKEARQKILKGHKKVCSWPTNPVTDAYLNPFHEDYLSPDDRERLKEDFVEKALRLQDLRNDLPHLTQEILREMELDDDSLKQLFRICGFPEHPASDDVDENITQHAVHSSSVVLALCGWDKLPNNHLPGLYCSDTGRTVGLWNFYSVSPDDETSSPISVKRRRLDYGTESCTIIEKGWFHPVSQHHVWSPWIVTLNPISALLNDSSVGPVNNNVKPGWKVVRDILLQNRSNSANENAFPVAPLPKSRTPPRLAVLQARRMLDDWSSP